MIAGLSLLVLTSALLVIGPRLASAPWTQQSPRVAIVVWQALTVSAVATVVLAGATLLIPITALAGGLGEIVRACAVSVAAAYWSSEMLAVKTVGAILAGVVPAWVLVTAARIFLGRWRRRRRLHRSLGLIAGTGSARRVTIIETDTPAAFCVPGRPARIVVTRGTVDHLSADELTGVLAHEEAHLRGRHSLAVTLSLVLARAFPRVRLFEVATRETRQLVELLADDTALKRVGRVDLASAIVSLAEMRAPGVALAMAQDAAALRVTRLLSPGAPAEPWRHRAAALGALLVVLTPLFIAGYPAMCAALSDVCAAP